MRPAFLEILSHFKITFLHIMKAFAIVNIPLPVFFFFFFFSTEPDGRQATELSRSDLKPVWSNYYLILGKLPHLSEPRFFYI